MSSERFEAKRAEALRIARMVRSPISRRGLLELAGWSALTGALAGCYPTKDPSQGEAALDDGNAKPAGGHVNPDYPRVTWEEGVAAVDQFLGQNNIRLFPESPVHSVCLMTSDKDPKKYIEVLFEPGREKPDLVKTFAYKYPENQANPPVPVRVLPSKMAEPNVRIGHTARGVNDDHDMPKCTAGWNIYYNARVACVSCFHVLCAKGNSSQVGSQHVELNNYIMAKLYCFQPMAINNQSAPNLWDLAIAEYNHEANAEGKCLTCGSGGIHTYPMALTPNTPTGQPVTGQIFHKVGAAAPICGYGTLVSTGATVSIPLLGGTAYFRGALKFTKLANSGDSGAIIVRDSDNTVSGLHFASNATYSYSNPLYQVPWTRDTTKNYRLLNGDWIPIYNCTPASPGRCC